MIKGGLSDKRKSYRMHIEIPVTVGIIDEKTNTVTNKIFMVKDLNSEGMYFVSDEPIALSKELNINFQLPRDSNSIQAKIKVVRVESREQEGNYGIGSIFTFLSDKDKEDVKKLVERLNIHKLLELALTKNASDLHLVTGMCPILRINGEIEASSFPAFDGEEIANVLYSVMNKSQIKKFEQEKELDFGIQYDDQSRFRVNVHQQRGFLEATFRLINTKISSFEDLNIPPIAKDLAGIKDGLILIVGPTGSGKTTTIATMIEHINQNRKAMIITLERPIEYVFLNKKSIIKQREIGIDTSSFSIALKSTLRQDPNVIVIGELEDLETVKTAIVAAEAGYLVIASFHAPNTIQAIDRLVGFFPTESRKQVLSQLANCLRGIISQVLIPRNDKKGRVLATEVMILNDAVKRIIRDDQLIQLTSVIQTGASQKMHPLSESIRKYLEWGVIDTQTAAFYSDEFNKYKY